MDTITDGVDSESLTLDPGRNATVLTHNDFAVEGPGVQLTFGGAGQTFKSSMCMKIIGVSGPFCMPTV